MAGLLGNLSATTTLPSFGLLPLAAALAGGAIATWLGVPLGWMIGAMLGVATLAWFAEAAAWEPIRGLSLLLLGLGPGPTIDRPVQAAKAAAQPPQVNTTQHTKHLVVVL